MSGKTVPGEAILLGSYVCSQAASRLSERYVLKYARAQKAQLALSLR